MSILDSATNAIKATENIVVGGLTSVLGGVADAVGGIFGMSDKITAAGTSYTTVPTLDLPLPNILNSYASYDYILSVGILTDNDLHNPNTTYLANKDVPLICKSANMNPNNRIDTGYGKHGKYDFFIDNLIIESQIGHEKNNNTSAFMMSFEILEPYSMGLFSTACQKAASAAGWSNWREAPFLLTIDFRGNTEAGKMEIIPTTYRAIPFKFGTLTMTVGPEGSKYQCSVNVYNQDALMERVAGLKSDTSVSGTTVQEVLQTGEKSLQAVINQRLQQLKTDGLVAEPDEVLIIFPTDISSSPNTKTESSSENNAGATTKTIDTANPEVLKQLGVARSEKNATLVQTAEQCNDMGRATLGFGSERSGDQPFGKEVELWDETNKVWIRADNVVNTAECDFRFSQNTDIMNAINQVMLQSDFPAKTFAPERLTPEGYRQWWKIDTQVFVINSDANLKTTGVRPKLYVYRVIPYLVHASSGPMPANTKAPGFTELYGQVLKHYNYIYTGKNSDIINFEIKYENTFHLMMSADGAKNTMDVKNADATGENTEKSVNTIKMEGNEPEPGKAAVPVSFSGVQSPTDRLGGGGNESASTRQARLFHDTINNSQSDMTQLEMTIIGDPYFIAQSGTGNYTAKSTQYTNLNADGSVNYQNGEVDILVHFRTPVDIDQSNGFMDFSGQTATSPVIEYSGFYRVNTITSTFKNGTFTQILHGNRRMLQDLINEAKAGSGFNNSSLSSEADTTSAIQPPAPPSMPADTKIASQISDAITPSGLSPENINAAQSSITSTTKI